ncbi:MULTISPECIES: hypothetical protein [Amycolatopsis]|uniref:Uncharacterized protein n=1 Tax=Amycolatopsis albidoflavus TaxID=102226 RepID=A0ABW5HSL0_9PSEU
MAVTVAFGRGFLSDDLARAEPGVFGSMASDPTASRLFAAPADDTGTAAATRERAGERAR